MRITKPANATEWIQLVLRIAWWTLVTCYAVISMIGIFYYIAKFVAFAYGG